ncbi:Phosphate acetyltransferase [Rubellimicrobium mesophilum DSM 19309]|uniref:Phosphate acetyltransferase n=1 Tax=Rubellimicrobium mesophilum DSM 19309 TaxID=442562 RepID=A0A017HV19_9RHOB|nr:phosphate acyltransferase [Rubellimicrobium mesophilum]EYD78170.1 Phosphate acetyltransferase [Rubellimicrobium mesophilum DSM 19309]
MSPLADDHPFLSRTPPHAPETLLAQARGCGVPRVALVNAGAPTPLQGLREACEEGLAEPILLGDPIKIHHAADAIGWDIRPFRLVPAPGESAAPKAAELAVAGEADAIMKGQIHTSTFLKGLLPSACGLRDKGTICGHVFHITAPGSDRPLFLTDAALNVAPDLATRQACLSHAVHLADLVGVARPYAGILAPSEDVTPTIPCSGEAAAIAAWAKGALRQAVVEGPLALDLMLSRASASVKGVESQVAGRVDIILVPELNAGNALFKLMSLGMGCCAAGVVMGARVPILLTSRGQGAPDRIASAALGAILAAEARDRRRAAA